MCIDSTYECENYNSFVKPTEAKAYIREELLHIHHGQALHGQPTAGGNPLQYYAPRFILPTDRSATVEIFQAICCP